MVAEWKPTKLSELIDVKHGWAFKGTGMSEGLHKEPIVVAIGNFNYTGGFRFGSTRIKRYTEEFPDEYILKPNDILLAMTCQTSGGEILGIPGRIPDDSNTYLHNQRLGKVIVKAPDKVSADYLYWLFLSRGFNHHLYVTASGTKILHTSPSRIVSYDFLLPPIKVQDAIADLLWTLHNKIELNRQMNETLEGMAQALFKSWFVDFDPVIDNALVAGNPIPAPFADRAATRRATLANGTANRTTAAPFPNAFHLTDTLGYVPISWEAGSILEHASLLSGGTPKTSEKAYWNGDVKWASAKDVSNCGKAFLTTTERTITQLGVDKSSTKIIPKFSTVIVARGATTGRLTMFAKDMAMNQTCYGLRMNSGNHFYGYSHATHFISSLVYEAHGSIFDTITTKTFRSSQVILPSVTHTKLYETSTQSLFARILENEYQSEVLAELRDTLLPKLISGELRIGNAEKLAAEAGA